MPNKQIIKIIPEFKRVLSDAGKVFIIECTEINLKSDHWFYRSVEEYYQLFEFFNLSHISDYYDCNQLISIFYGKK